MSNRKRHNLGHVCRNVCGLATNYWSESKATTAPSASAPQPLSNGQPQGPFPLPGGGALNILPLPSAVMTPAASQSPSADALVGPAFALGCRLFE
jgi:hypothetical protein